MGARRGSVAKFRVIGGERMSKMQVMVGRNRGERVCGQSKKGEGSRGIDAEKGLERRIKSIMVRCDPLIGNILCDCMLSWRR